MSNVQQALAMGRRRLDENAVYQHTTLQERTENHDEFLTFSSAQEKMSFVHEAIRNRRILGGVTDTYHRIKSEQDIVAAERFLSMHAQAMDVTPYGACSHDFSQAPAPSTCNAGITVVTCIEPIRPLKCRQLSFNFTEAN